MDLTIPIFLYLKKGVHRLEDFIYRVLKRNYTKLKNYMCAASYPFPLHSESAVKKTAKISQGFIF